MAEWIKILPSQSTKNSTFPSTKSFTPESFIWDTESNSCPILTDRKLFLGKWFKFWTIGLLYVVLSFLLKESSCINSFTLQPCQLFAKKPHNIEKSWLCYLLNIPIIKGITIIKFYYLLSGFTKYICSKHWLFTVVKSSLVILLSNDWQAYLLHFIEYQTAVVIWILCLEMQKKKKSWYSLVFKRYFILLGSFDSREVTCSV